MRTPTLLFLICAPVIGCSDAGSPTETNHQPPQDCAGGCARAPLCNEDGAAPSPYPRCSCACTPGTPFPDGVCNENRCITPYGDAGVPPDATASDMACGADAGSPDRAAIAPSTETWRTTRDSLEQQNDPETSPFPLTVDPTACQEGRWQAWLPQGSAFAHVHRRDDGDCEAWLGGELEAPTYDGLPTQYCRFPSDCASVTVVTGDQGGPAITDSPYCVEPYD